MELPFRVIDADGHVLEHGVDWGARPPARFRKDAPGWLTLLHDPPVARPR